MTPDIPKTCKAIVCNKQGPESVLQLQDIQVPTPGPDQVLLRTEWTGVNYIDTFNRSGIYKHPTPLIIGNEPAGEVVAVGQNVKHLKVGDKAVTFGSLGGYSQYSLGPANTTAALPDGVTTKAAASSFLQGITALTNVLEAHSVKPGEWILVHAAAGGVGSLICRLAKSIGATVVATTSTEEKAKVARFNGADYVVLYGNRKMEDVVKDIKALTPLNEGVDASFDGVGKDTFDYNFDLVKRKGTIVLVGAASGPVPPFPPLKLMPKSQKLIRPGCPAYLATLPEFLSYAEKLFTSLKAGALTVSEFKPEGYSFTNDGVQQAHKDIGGRVTTGKLLIKVE